VSEHRVRIEWNRRTADFEYTTYDRTHKVTFEGGTSIESSAAPEYQGKKELSNPEEMLAAALASCHMLTFLAVASRSHFIVDAYSDDAVATLGKNSEGKLTVTEIKLSPRVKFSVPLDPERFKRFHEKAHSNCFIAQALSCRVEIDPVQF
jgi:organic hydroperoxide reductase OsmC/OhrA